MEKTTTSIMRKVLLGAAILCLLLTFLCACDRQDAPSVDETAITSVESDASAATHDEADTETSAPTDGESEVTETTADTPHDDSEESTAEETAIELPKVEFD